MTSSIVNVHGDPITRETTPAPEYPRAQLLGDLLYFHLTCARESATRMDLLPVWGPSYEAEHATYDAAIKRAREKLMELKREGFVVPTDLIPLLTAEGLLS